MSTKPDWVEIDRQAVARASSYAPPPPMDPTQAGITGLFVVGMVLAVFTGLAGMSEGQIAIPLVVCAAGGFAIPYFYCRSIQSAHTEAVIRERQQIVKSLSS